jgi:hypothetical protein
MDNNNRVIIECINAQGQIKFQREVSELDFAWGDISALIAEMSSDSKIEITKQIVAAKEGQRKGFSMKQQAIQSLKSAIITYTVHNGPVNITAVVAEALEGMCFKDGTDPRIHRGPNDTIVSSCDARSLTELLWTALELPAYSISFKSGSNLVPPVD